MKHVINNLTILNTTVYRL